MSDVVIDRRNVKDSGNQYLENKKHIALFLTGWIGFQIIALILAVLVVSIYGKTEILNEASISMAINCVSYGILVTCLFAIFGFTNLGNLIKKFKFIRTYIAAAVCVVTIIAFDNFYSIILNSIKTNVVDNVNETNIVSLTTMYPLFSIIFFGIVGPICEEMTYRIGLFSLCNKKSKALAYIITIVVFALIHFNFDCLLTDNIDTDLLINELLNLPFYLFAGLAFAFTYDHYGFEASATAHIVNNLLSLLVSIFSK